MLRRATLRSRNGDSSIDGKSSRTVLSTNRGDAKPIEINCKTPTKSVVFLPGGEYFVSGDEGGKIRRWRVEDGREMGTPMNAGSEVNGIAVSADGKLLVSGTRDGMLSVWNPQSHDKASEFKGHRSRILAVDVSADGQRIASGSYDDTLCVWSLAGAKLLGPLEHVFKVVAVKFSPDGRLIATATWERRSVRVYDSHDGRLLFDAPVEVNSQYNQSVAWASDGSHLFALSKDSQIHTLDTFTGKTLSKWRTHSSRDPNSIALANKDVFIAASGGSSVSFWDPATHKKRLGPVIKHAENIRCMAISANHDIVLGGDLKITLRGFSGNLPFHYTESLWQVSRPSIDTVSVRSLSSSYDLAAPLQTVEKGKVVSGSNSTGEGPNHEISHLEKTNENLRNELLVSQTNVESLRTELAQLRHEFEKSSSLLSAHEKKHHCEVLYAAGRARDAALSLIEITSTMNEVVKSNQLLIDWIAQFTLRCASTLEQIGDESADAQKHQEALASYSVALSFASPAPANILLKWVKGMMICGSVNEVLDVAVTKFRLSRFSIYQTICNVLEQDGRVMEAVVYFRQMQRDLISDPSDERLQWEQNYQRRLVDKLEKLMDTAIETHEYDNATECLFTVLSLGRVDDTVWRNDADEAKMTNVLIKWASKMVIHNSVNDTLHTAMRFSPPMFLIYQTMCDVLERDKRIADAITCFREMQVVLAEDAGIYDERARWERNFKSRCTEKLEELADIAIEANQYAEAIEHLSSAFSLDASVRMSLLVKRSKARVLMGSWEDALSDANEAIKLDPSSHQGYERRHAALHGASRHAEAVEAFDRMLSKIDNSPHEDICKLRSQFTDARPAIRRIVRQTIRNTPSILIDTTTGRLFDKNQQAAAFEALPIWHELVSSMTRVLDHARIGVAIKEFYKYVMLSHTWEEDEPLLQKIKTISVYRLESSPANLKLKDFCSLVYLLGFRWAWADTTCIDQKDNVVLQESLVAMFSWYRGSSLTLIYLCDISSESDAPGGLQRSKWNTRGWTYQEYVAADTVRFYTGDWKPYLGLTLDNHKDSPIVISEMLQATGMSVEDMAKLEPGLNRVREKLFVASMRQTTRTEDMAYSLLGIFNISIPVIYGEGDRAVGRLLEHILTGSGDISILAWTGRAGSYNSSLPVDLTVYNELVPPHIPQTIEAREMDCMVTALRSSTLDLSGVLKLYNELKALPPPFFAASRLRLAGLNCHITNLEPTSSPDPLTNLCVYRATTSLFGDIELKTTADLTVTQDLSLFHPWVRIFLQQLAPRRGSIRDRTTPALRLLARLRQPFGALLLEEMSLGEYKRVAADSVIMVQIREDVSLDELTESIDTIDIQ